jgi:hypothetical protein
MFETIAVLSTISVAVIFIGLIYMDRVSRREDGEKS